MGRGLLVEIANDVADRGEGCLQRLSVYPNQHALETGDVVERRCPQLESPWSLLTARNQKDTGDTKRCLDRPVRLALGHADDLAQLHRDWAWDVTETIDARDDQWRTDCNLIRENSQPRLCVARAASPGSNQ